MPCCTRAISIRLCNVCQSQHDQMNVIPVKYVLFALVLDEVIGFKDDGLVNAKTARPLDKIRQVVASKEGAYVTNTPKLIQTGYLANLRTWLGAFLVFDYKRCLRRPDRCGSW